jgi:hypothetical protein
MKMVGGAVNAEPELARAGDGRARRASGEVRNASTSVVRDANRRIPYHEHATLT